MKPTEVKFIYSKELDKYYPEFDFIWEVGLKGSKWYLEISKDFPFDSSVPKKFQWIVSKHHVPWLLAACVHDKLLELGHDKAFAAGEWFRAARAKEKEDNKARLVKYAYYGVVLWTVK